jgi:hypothetical protein
LGRRHGDFYEIPDQDATARKIVMTPLPFSPSMPTFASSLKSRRRPLSVEECQRGQRKPNEDAVAMPSRVIRDSVRGFATRSRAKLKWGAIGRKTGAHFC